MSTLHNVKKRGFMSKNIFIWVAHPKATNPSSGTLCEGLADAYQKGAQASGANVRRINLGDMVFTTEFDGYTTAPPLEQDITSWQDAITWADHIVIIHPYWWGAMPAKAKAVLDRALTPEFAYKYHAKSMKWDKLLSGKTADAIITSDTPPLIDTLIYIKPARRVIKNQVLGFCGIKTKSIIQFGSVKMASPKKINGWITRVEKLGSRAAT